MRLSAVMNVYNEERLLPVCLSTLLPVFDEVILVEGSEIGSSTDGTIGVAEHYQSLFPNKVTIVTGTFKREDGAWDDARQSNVGLAKATGDFIMRTAADMIYDWDDVAMIREMAERYPNKKHFYAPQLEFFWDTKHINLQDTMTTEPCLPRAICSDPVLISSRVGLRCFDTEEGVTASTTEQPIDWRRDVVYLIHVKRFHYAYVKPFGSQVEKIVKYVKHGDHRKIGAEVLARGEKAVYDYAINLVLGWERSSNCQPYAGLYPRAGETLRDMKVMDGYEQFMSWYRKKFNLRGEE